MDVEESPSGLQDVGVQRPLAESQQSEQHSQPATSTSRISPSGNTSQGKEGETAAETHPETRIRDDEAARKSAIMKVLLGSFEASDIDPERALAEKSLQGIYIYDWWEYEYLVDKTMTDCAVIELKHFEHHHENELNSYQFSLFQQIAESDLVLCLLQAIFWSDTELLAFPQGVEKVTPNHDGIVLPPLPTVRQHGSGATLLPVENVELSTPVVLRPTLLPALVIMELSKGALSSKFAVVEAVQKLRSEGEPVPLDLRDLSPQVVIFIENSPILLGISPLSDAILGRRSYLEAEVQEDIKILLGEDRNKAWEYITNWRMAACASIQLSNRPFMEIERTTFADRAFVFFDKGATVLSFHQDLFSFTYNWHVTKNRTETFA